MSGKQIRVGVFGYGCVGQGVVTILCKNAELISSRAGVDVKIVHVCSRSIEKHKGDFGEEDVDEITLSSDVEELLSDDSVEIIVELIGGYELPYDVMKRALSKGKHVVTANKAAISRYGEELGALAASCGVLLRYEAAVAACIPILRLLTDSLVGDEISSVKGIINGSTNYILTKMHEGEDYSAVVARAKEMGYLEADPSFDLEGKDAAQKIAIVASLVSGKWHTEDDVETTGITGVTNAHVESAKASGKIIKLIAEYSSKGTLSVGPQELDLSHPLANVNNELNALFVESENAGQIFLQGSGAGMFSTASAVVSDIVAIGKAVAATDSLK